MSQTFHSAEIVKTAEGRQYHIGVAPNEIAPYLLLCGDPKRAHRIAKYFDKANDPITYREYVTITGVYKGVPLSVMATGIGPDNTEIAVIEISQLVKNPTFLRIGSCGGIQKGVKLADLIISTGAVRMENTSTYFVNEGYPAVAHHEIVLALLESAKKSGCRYHVGLTATASGFYGGQARNVPGFKPRYPELINDLERMNVVNLEMEASCLFTLAQVGNFRSGTVCAAYSSRSENSFIDKKTMEKAEKDCIEVGLGAVEVLNKMDQKKKKDPFWIPSMGL